MGQKTQDPLLASRLKLVTDLLFYIQTFPLTVVFYLIQLRFLQLIQLWVSYFDPFTPNGNIKMRKKIEKEKMSQAEHLSNHNRKKAARGVCGLLRNLCS